MSLLIEENVAPPEDTAVSKNDFPGAAATARNEEEAADFITRQVLERGATLFDG